MRILHAIASLDNSNKYLSRYLLELLRSMSDHNETHIVTFSNSKLLENKGISVHTLSPCKTFTHKRLKREAQQLIATVRPDVIHIHGCWDWSLAEIGRLAATENIPCVLSPHHSLDPEVIDTFFYTQRLPKLIAYQYSIVRDATVIHAISDRESSNLYKLGWNTRIITVPSPQGGNIFQYSETAGKMNEMYRMAIDAICTFRTLSDRERNILMCLVLKGSEQTGKYYAVNEEYRKNIGSLTSEEWRRIYIVCAANHQTESLTRAFSEIGIKAPDMPNDITESLSRPINCSESTLNEQEILALTPSEEQVLSGIEDPKIRQVVVMLLNIHKLIKQKSVNIGHISALYSSLMYEDYDERLLSVALKRLHIHKFTARMETVLQWLCGLTEGFMPIPNDTGKGSKRLIKTIKEIL